MSRPLFRGRGPPSTRRRSGRPGEPDVARFVPGTSSLPTDPNLYPLAYLPVVAEFFPHDYVDASVFKDNSVTPLLVQNIVISR